MIGRPYPRRHPSGWGFTAMPQSGSLNAIHACLPLSAIHACLPCRPGSYRACAAWTLAAKNSPSTHSKGGRRSYCPKPCPAHLVSADAI